MITEQIIRSFLICQHKSYLQFHKKSGDKTPFELLEEQLLQSAKSNFLQQLSLKVEEHQIIANIPVGKNCQFIQNAYSIQPVFRSMGEVVSFDVIEIVPHTEFPDKLSYVPIDVVGKETVSKAEKLVLTIKSLLLRRMQKLPLESGMIVYGRNLKTTKVTFAHYSQEAQRVLKGLMQTVSLQESPRFYWNKHCKICEFCNVCDSILREKDDLSLLVRMTEKDVIKQNSKGIFTTLQFSYTYSPRRRKKGITTPQRFEPALKALAIRESKTYIKEIPTFSNVDVEVYMDFEGLPDENFVYLIGLIIVHQERETHFSFWADSQEDEEQIFVQLFDTLSPFSNFTVYHYGSYETRVLKKITSKFGTPYEDEVNCILDHSVNILSFFTSTIYPPTYNNGLKDIARFLGFRWSERDASGIQSIVWRGKWELAQDATYKGTLIQYNIEDCQALILTKRWLVNIDLELRNENSDTFVEVASLKPKHPYKWGRTKFLEDSFKEINQYAYFDYQRTKIFLKTNAGIKKAVKKEEKRLKGLNKVDKVVDLLHYESCPTCGCKEIKRRHLSTKTNIDLKFTKNGVKRTIIRFKGGYFKCTQCPTKFTAQALKNIPRRGRNLIIWTVNQHIGYRMSFESVIASLQETFNLHMSRSTLIGFQTRAAEWYKETYEAIKHSIISGRLIHVDETTVSVRNLPGAYVWVFTNMNSVFYMFRESRETDFLKELLQDFAGVLISDFYAGYESLPCPQQKCLIHLIRDLNNDLFKHQFDTEFKQLVTHFGKLLQKIIGDTIPTYGLKKSHLQKHVQDVNKFYRQTVECECESELAQKYQLRFQKYRTKLFTFLDYDGIPWNNNNAETAVKSFAAHRRIVDGNFTEDSIPNYLILTSIKQTCRYRGIRFLDFLKSGEKDIDKYSQKS